MASRAYRVRLHNTVYPMCVAQIAARGTVEIRMTIGCTRAIETCNLDLI